MTTNTCRHCKETKPQEEFKKSYKKNLHRKLKYTTLCLECATNRNSEWRRNKSKSVNDRVFKTRTEKKLKAIAYKGGKCLDCEQVVHLAAFDFHHVDPSTKEGNLGTILRLSDSRVYRELDKCILLCSNCHRVRHFNED